MMKSKKIESKQVGLEIAQIFGKYLFDTEDLHYGYWPADLDVSIFNFAQAQAHHSQLIIDHIPQGVKRILDVGGGAGNFAVKLQAHGYRVDCVTPSAFLAERIREKLGDSGRVFECRYEDLELSDSYDLILFSESFQYIDPAIALDQSAKLLAPGGYVLICDCFKKEAPGKDPIRSGHRLSKFYDLVTEREFETVLDQDITKEIAPSFDVFKDMIDNLALPIRDLVNGYAREHYPRLTRFVSWKFRRRIDKVHRRYFSDTLHGDSFAQFKSYRLMVFRRSASP